MKLPPAWKVKRELFRLGRQIRNIPRNLFWFFLATPYYDMVLARKRQTWDGQQDQQPKLAVYVIYPSAGLQDSHLLTLRHLAENGYSTLIVSNLPLSETDRTRLLPHCQCYMERENFGYDFGAYRDGVLSLIKHLNNTDRLVLMNDSAWYPLPNSSNWLTDAEALGVDYAGAVSNYGTPRTAHDTYQELTWNYRTDHPNFHYCSFALSFSPRFFRSRQFVKYWKNLRLDNDKSRVVRRGEIGLTQWAIKHGFTHDCTCNPMDLMTVLEGVSDARLRELVERTMFPEYPLAQAKKPAVLSIPIDDPSWRPMAIRFVLLGATSQGTSYALAELTTKEMRFPFLKKSPLRLSKSGSDISLDIIAEIPGETGDIIAAEAQILRQNRTTKYDELERP